MKILYILTLLFIPYHVSSQISIEPHINLSKVWFSTDNSPDDINIDIGDDVNGIEYGFGFELNSRLFRKFNLSLKTHWSQAIKSGRYYDLNFQGHVSFDENRSAISRWSNSIYFSYLFIENASIGLGGKTIYQTSVLGNYFGRDSQPYRVTEFGLSTRIKLLVKKLTISLEYHHGLKNRGGFFYYFDPLRTIGITLGYPIALKNK